MVQNEPRTSRSRQIPEYSKTVKLGPHVVFEKCYVVSGGRRRRYELHLSCRRRTAVVDVPTGGLEEVEATIDDSIWAFGESLRLQGLI